MFSRIITYSRNVFIPVTNMCRNNCAYCGFRREPKDPQAYILRPGQVEDILLRGVHSGCSEALFTFGEQPEANIEYQEQLRAIGYEHTLDYLMDLCRMAISMGLLPHSNPGVLSYRELEVLAPFNASMGLMLETTADLDVHRDCPGKVPGLRIKTIENAGRLKIPFTTGLLIGIGETHEDRIESLRIIEGLHKKYGHIQEVIIQNFTPKPNTETASRPPPKIEEMVWTVEQARRILPSDIAIQVPPNLVSPGKLIQAGASDLGGISPETIDHINPEHKWPAVEELQNLVGKNMVLRERLPIYPQYIRRGWFSEELSPLIACLAGDDGYRKVHE